MAKRTYNVKGTKDFLVLALIFFFLCLWAVKDAWYPSPGVMKKHPPEIELAFETGGTISRLHVAEGDPVGEKQLVAELGKVKLEGDFAEARKAYTDAKNKVVLAESSLKKATMEGLAEENIAEMKGSHEIDRAAMDDALVAVNELKARLDACALKSESKGEVKEIKTFVYGQVEAGETVIVIDPKDHFYTFNKSLAVFSFIAFWVFLSLHILAN